MLDRPSDDEVSRQILGVFMRYRIPASGTLQRNYCFDIRDGDFQRGINKAVASAQPLPLSTHGNGLFRRADGGRELVTVLPLARNSTAVPR